jgi:glucokinase
VRQVVTADIGGTHARFAIATIDSNRMVQVSEPVILKTDEHPSLETAWAELRRRMARELPRELAIAVAGPIIGDALKLTNNPWVIRPRAFSETLGVHRWTVINDFGAVAHAVAVLDQDAFKHQCGPEVPLQSRDITTILGPGTGLGVAALLFLGQGNYHVIETEAGHVDFAPLDSVEDRILSQLRSHLGRVSIERVISGRGLFNIYAALGVIENRPIDIHDDKELWSVALSGHDQFATAALERFCLVLGAIAGDMALAHGATRVVISGGLGLKLSEYLTPSGFHDRFIAKGRFAGRMARIPVQLVRHRAPGLLGAAVAFAGEHA